MSTPQDPFENDIRSLQRRALPADWRAEILAAAAQPAPNAKRPTRTPRWLVAGWSTAWAAILLMWLTTPAEPRAPPSVRTTQPAPSLHWDQRVAVINDLLAAN